MSEYNFSTLNDKDFEVLVRDLLTRELSIPFQNFKAGSDKGIDLRYSTNSSENEIVVQVKHYLKSGYSQLLNTLKNSEKSKIETLNPRRYIIATSIELSPNDKERIKYIFDPFINNTNDVYGYGDLNRLITKFGDIEKKHFKLWFSNINIIQKIVNNGIEGRSAFIEEKIKKNIKLYVINKSFEDSIEILRKHKVLLITGIPGIGKTTLANLITYQLLSKDFRLIYIDERIKEAEDTFDNDIKVKQLFYFDDFLGSNYLEIVNSRNTDSSIANFIERIISTKNKYLILTTRSTILNQAKSQHEKLSRVNLNSLKYEIEIEKYSLVDRAKILYNHLYFNELPKGFINEIFRDRNYWRIINHINYNPRLIEFFTKEQNINHLQQVEYFDFIMSHLDNPNEIWDSAFINQLNDSEKYLIFTLLSFGKGVFKQYLEPAFEERIGIEVTKHGFTRHVNIFNISFKNLLDGYITNTINSIHSSISSVDFINPSLRDYLIYFFNKNSTEKWRTIESFIYIEQFLMIFRKRSDAKNNVIIELNEIRKFLEISNSKRLKSVFSHDQGNINLRYVYLFNSYKQEDNREYIDGLIIEKLQNIEWQVIKILFLNDLLPIIEEAKESGILYLFFENNWDIIIEKLVEKVESDFDMSRIMRLFSKYNKLYSGYRFEDERWFNLISQAVNQIFWNEAQGIIDLEQNEVYSKSDFDNMEERIFDRFIDLSNKYMDGAEVSPEKNPLSDIDPDEVINENNRAQSEVEEFDHYEYEDYISEENKDEQIINDMFSSLDN